MRKMVYDPVLKPGERKLTPEIESQVYMALTQYDDYGDYCDLCYDEFKVTPWMSEEEYIQYFNEKWACPEGYETPYECCQEHRREVLYMCTICTECRHYDEKRSVCGHKHPCWKEKGYEKVSFETI